ncbi:MAG: hypothetical protein EOM20_08365 [Spartobacteria bacterium]|nr:hypothetical protein [Spartobacteria bacterium]
MDFDILDASLSLLEARLRIAGSEPLQLVVCGGSALVATRLVLRTTKDVDILAYIDAANQMQDPDPMPDVLVNAARVVAETLNLPEDWLNTGPADLFRMGLPDGFACRLIERKFGPILRVHFISRIDQIHFKLYASVDRGGYHIDDLMALKPTTKEMVQAAKWSTTHDVSEGYVMLLKNLLTQLGFDDATREL